jgi:hypothetical protein
MEMQQRELKEQIEEGESIRNDKAEAEKAEEAAKQAELEVAAEALRIEELAAASRSKKSKADDDWITRSRLVILHSWLCLQYFLAAVLIS